MEVEMASKSSQTILIIVLLLSTFIVSWFYAKVGLGDYLEQLDEIDNRGYMEIPSYLKRILLFILFGFFTGVGRHLFEVIK